MKLRFVFGLGLGLDCALSTQRPAFLPADIDEDAAQQKAYCYQCANDGPCDPGFIGACGVYASVSGWTTWS